MKNIAYLIMVILMGLGTVTIAQKLPHRPGSDIRIVNNEIIEYQKDGLINWTRGYLQGIGSMSVKTPHYEDGAMGLASSNLLALFEEVRIIDTVTLHMFAGQTTVGRTIYRILRSSVRWMSLSPGEIRGETYTVRASIDFETLLNLRTHDTTLRQLILASYTRINTEKANESAPPGGGNGASDSRPGVKLQEVVDSLKAGMDVSDLEQDTLSLVVTDTSGKTLSIGNDLKPSVINRFQVRYNGITYDAGPSLNNKIPPELGPVAWGLLEVAKNTVIKKGSIPDGMVKAIKMADGSILIDLDSIIDPNKKSARLIALGSDILRILANSKK